MSDFIHNDHVSLEDDLYEARSLVALLRHAASLDGAMADDARQGFYFVAQQVEKILTACIEREGNLSCRPHGWADQCAMAAPGMPE